MVHFIEIIVFGSLILLSFLLLANPFNVNGKANRWLGLFALLWSTFWLEEVMELSLGNYTKLISTPVISLIQFLMPIALLICVKYFTNPNYKFSKTSLQYLIVPVIYLVILLLKEKSSNIYQPVLLGILMLHSLFYISLCYINIRKHQRHIKSFASNTSGVDLYWLEYIMISMLLLIILIVVFNLLYYAAPLNLLMNVITLVIIFFVAYNSLKQKEIYPIDKQERIEMMQVSVEEDCDDIPRRKILSDDKLVELKSQLNKLMQQEEPYLDTDLNLINLSKQLQVSTNHLSYVINAGFDENFYSYVNKFRVEKAKLLLKNNTSNHLSILGIAYESGFSSKTSFNTTFKKITGLTPSEYKKRSSDI